MYDQNHKLIVKHFSLNNITHILYISYRNILILYIHVATQAFIPTPTLFPVLMAASFLFLKGKSNMLLFGPNSP
jgi:hypothetical protein